MQLATVDAIRRPIETLVANADNDPTVGFQRMPIGKFIDSTLGAFRERDGNKAT